MEQHTTQLKLLVLTSRFPYPLEKGDKLRVFHQIRLLSQEFNVVLISLCEESVSAEHLAVLRKYCDQIYTIPLPKWKIAINILRALWRGDSLQAGYFFSSSIQHKINQIIVNENPDRIYVQLIRAGKYLEEAKVPKVLDFMDVFSGQMQRRAEHSTWPGSWFFRREAKAMVNLEERLFRAYQRCTIISEQDREQLDFQGKEKVHIIPNGINTKYFQAKSSEKTYEIVFVGNMGYHPNVVAAQFLVKKIMPLVWAKNENVRVLLAGARPAPEVKRLAGKRITVSGWLEDIRDAYSCGKLFVAPLFLGSGQQNKILEAMSMELPCITSPMVNNAIGAKAEEQILLAETENEFAQQILYLLDHPNLQLQLGKSAAAFIVNRFSWEHSVHKLIQLVKPE